MKYPPSSVTIGPFSIEFYMSSKDGVPVIHVDTEALGEDTGGPVCRIHINDHVLHENPPYLDSDKKTNEH